MAVPKRKTSKAKRDSRRAQNAHSAMNRNFHIEFVQIATTMMERT